MIGHEQRSCGIFPGQPERGAGCARSSNDPALTPAWRCAQTAAAPGSRPAAKQCPAHCRSPRNIRSAAHESRFPAPGSAGPSWLHKTSGKALPRTGQTSRRPEARSAVDRKDAPATAPTPRSRSKCLLAYLGPCRVPIPIPEHYRFTKTNTMPSRAWASRLTPRAASLLSHKYVN